MPLSTNNLPEYHSFMDYPDFGDSIPGIIVPQEKIQVVAQQEQQAVYCDRKIASFAVEGRKGVRIIDVLTKKDIVLDPSPKEEFLHLDVKAIQVALKWPGCDTLMSESTKYSALNTLHSLATFTAFLVLKFYRGRMVGLNKQADGTEWQPIKEIPFDRLYLLELRLVDKEVVQPVLFYNVE